MPRYYCYTLTTNGTVEGQRPIDADDDASAIQQAEAILNTAGVSGIQLWLGQRVILSQLRPDSKQE